MNIGYAKLGRSFDLDPARASVAGGDIDVIRLLQRMARDRPDDTFYVWGRNAGGDMRALGYPKNVINLWENPKLRDIPIGKIEDMTEPFLEAVGPTVLGLDHHIIWAGQHGSTNTRGIPPIKGGESTNPQVSALKYSAYILQTLNKWRDQDPHKREEIWLCPDPRNYLKCRDIKWPLFNPVLAQFSQVRNMKHERYGDTKTPAEYAFDTIAEVDPDSRTRWLSSADYTYAGVELTALRAPVKDATPWAVLDRQPFGIISNENRAYVKDNRRVLLKDWVLQRYPQTEVYGIWSDEAKLDLGISPEPIPVSSVYKTFARWKCTFTMPASGSGWATAKAWEAFRSGTICFFHPGYDTQDNILGPQSDLSYLRVKSPEELWKKVEEVNTHDLLYQTLAKRQYLHFVAAFAKYQGGAADIYERLDN